MLEVIIQLWLFNSQGYGEVFQSFLSRRVEIHKRSYYTIFITKKIEFWYNLTKINHHGLGVVRTWSWHRAEHIITQACYYISRWNGVNRQSSCHSILVLLAMAFLPGDWRHRNVIIKFDHRIQHALGLAPFVDWRNTSTRTHFLPDKDLPRLLLAGD